MSEIDPPPPRPPIPRWRDHVEHRWADPRVRAAILVVLAGVVGLVWFRLGRAETLPAVRASRPTRSRAEPPRASTSTTRPQLFVHVAGAVARPGLVRVGRGARVADAITAAGGPVPEADLDRLNLAATVADGQRIPVARRGDPLDTAMSGSAASLGGAASPIGDGGKVSLNTATAEQLDTLPGIGPTLAAAIIRERDRRGGFTRVEQVQDVRGIGEARYADLRDLVTV